MLSTWRDPFRTFDEIEREVLDPFVSQSIVSDLLPNKRRNLPRLLFLDVFESENEFKVIVEVRMASLILLSDWYYHVSMAH